MDAEDCLLFAFHPPVSTKLPNFFDPFGDKLLSFKVALQCFNMALKCGNLN
jgi:hypothetical protein